MSVTRACKNGSDMAKNSYNTNDLTRPKITTNDFKRLQNDKKYKEWVSDPIHKKVNTSKSKNIRSRNLQSNKNYFTVFIYLLYFFSGYLHILLSLFWGTKRIFKKSKLDIKGKWVGAPPNERSSHRFRFCLATGDVTNIQRKYWVTWSA